jgi:hypothetical protein
LNPRDFCREPGYDKAVLFTYDFDALFFERMILRDLWLGGATDIQVIADLGRVAEAQQRWIGQVRELGRRYRLNCANLRGAFHPKVLLRTGPKGALVWIGSGNLTYGGWNGNLEVGTAWRMGVDSGDAGGWLGALLDQLGEWLPANYEDTAIRRIATSAWLTNLGALQVVSPILVSRVTSPIGMQLLDRWQGRQFSRVTLVTGSTDEEGALLRWFHQQFGVSSATVLVDPSMASFDQERIRTLPLEINLIAPKDLRRVHAKFYWFEGADGPAAVMGSANCSAAAWLLSPVNGGNIEAVVVYDQPVVSDFAEVLARFTSDKTMQAVLAEKCEDQKEDGSLAPTYPVAEISWERISGELTITFARPLPAQTEVWVSLCGVRSLCHALSDTRIWYAKVSGSVTTSRGSLFGEVSIILTDGHSPTNQRFWVNDLAELRSFMGGHEFRKPISSLRRSSTTSEQQKIVAALQKIGHIILKNQERFPDPISRGTRVPVGRVTDDMGVKLSATDPEQLIRSLAEFAIDGRHQSVFGLHAVTLTGVMRALFELDDEESEKSSVGETEDPDEVSPAKRPPDRDLHPAPAEPARQKLKKQIDIFIDSLGDSQFATKCTVNQLVQAAAYPLAIVANGTAGGWVDFSSGREWTNRVFDTLFSSRYPNNCAGLLQFVERRCREDGQDEAFRQIVGDGKLWAALLAGIRMTSWNVHNGGFRKALAMRAVLMSQSLLASAALGHLAALVIGLEQTFNLPSFLDSAARAQRALSELEAYIHSHWDLLMREQSKAGTRRLRDDAHYHPTGGWAFAIEQDNNTPDAHLRVYRQNRADEATVMAGFYLNVTAAAEKRTDLINLLRELAQLAGSVS